MAVEPSSGMMDVAMQLFQNAHEQEAEPEHLQRQKSHISWRRFLNENVRRKYDVVMASFVLNEIANEKERERVIRALWNNTNGVLVFVEPGTPMGFRLIEHARATVLAQRDRTNPLNNPTVLSPCAHDGVCPMTRTVNSWCHFT